jgi:DNA primase
MAETIQVDGRTIEITHPDRILYPEEGIAKRGVIDY